MGEMVNYEAEKLDILSSVNEIVIQESKSYSFSFPTFPSLVCASVHCGVINLDNRNRKRNVALKNRC